MLQTDAAFASLSPQALAQDIGRVAGVAGAAEPVSGTGFQALFQQVRSEVVDFIANGSSESSVPALSGDGWLQQQRIQGSAALAHAESDGVSQPEQQAFLQKIAPWAETSAAQLGVSPHLVAAHAALESGWGQKPLRLADGQDSLNLFSIKAQGHWRGNSTAALTTEYEHGQAMQQTERFRAYPDYATAFQDYTHLLTSNPRYQGALNVGSDAKAFAQALARGGYATDPHYADKLASVAAMVKSHAATAASHSRD